MSSDLFVDPIWGVVGIPGNIWTPSLGPDARTTQAVAAAPAASAASAPHGSDIALVALPLVFGVICTIAMMWWMVRKWL